MTTEFYVYLLIDPRNNLPFYVGKGKDRRAWSHAENVANGRSSGNLAKDKLIKAIFKSRHYPEVKIVATYEDEKVAYDHEIDLIASFSGLCNIQKGGGGRSISIAEAERRQAERQKEIWLKNQLVLKDWLCKVDSVSGACHIPIHPNGSAVGASFLEIVRELVAA